MSDEIPRADTESLFRWGVDKEKSGFDQCRNKLMGYIDRRIEQWTPGEYDDLWPSEEEVTEGRLAAYKDVLEYLKGVERGSEQPEI